MELSILRHRHPRLYRPADDPEYRFAPPGDRDRQQILRNILVDCRAFESVRPWKRIPTVPDSPHPYHQLYVTFYTAMQATALIEHYAFAWRLTGDERWLRIARRWLLAAARWEHGDRIEEHFYTANRYMHAFAFAMDLLSKRLPSSDRKLVSTCLTGLMERWWPEVDRNRHFPSGGHHPVVDNGHFGVAAVHLLGKHPDAPAWVEAVIDRFRGAIMANGCGKDGEPYDGPSFWPWENLWMLHFVDALRNVTGIDLSAEFPSRLSRPLKWFRYQLHITITGERQLHACAPALLRLAQEAGDGEMRDVALRNRPLGRIYRFGAGVRRSSAECMTAVGPYTYLYMDPGFEPSRRRRLLPPSRKFTKAHYGETAVLRSRWDPRALMACISGYRGGGAHGFSNLHIQWAGHPVLKTISCEEAVPVGCGSLPSVGGQNEVYARLGRLENCERFDRIGVRSTRVHHEYWLLRTDPPVLLVALRRRPRGMSVMREDGKSFVRLNGRDSLQYPRAPYFTPNAGKLRLRVRLNAELDPDRVQVLFGAGFGVGNVMGTQVNNFAVGLLGTDDLTFAVQSQRAHNVQVSVPSCEARLEPGRWHDVGIAWGGLNRRGGEEFIQVELDGHRRRCDDGDRFGELGLDSQGLQSRTSPRAYYTSPNTLLAFGGAIQMPNTGATCDIAHIDLVCPGRKRLVTDFRNRLSGETGSGPVAFKLNPVDLRSVERTCARLGAGARALRVLPLYPDDASFGEELVPYAPSGLAASSTRSLSSGSKEPSTRLLASTNGDLLVLAFVPGNRGPGIQQGAHGFTIRTSSGRYAFDIRSKGTRILRMR